MAQLQQNPFYQLSESVRVMEEQLRQEQKSRTELEAKRKVSGGSFCTQLFVGVCCERVYWHML